MPDGQMLRFCMQTDSFPTFPDSFHPSFKSILQKEKREPSSPQTK